MIRNARARLWRASALTCFLLGCTEEPGTPPGPLYPWPAPSTGVDAGGVLSDGDGSGDASGDATGDASGDGSSDGSNLGDGDNLGDGGEGSGDGEPETDAGGGDSGQGSIDPPPSVGSAGCGNGSFPESGTYNIDVNGTSRMYIVQLPDDYDPEQPYRLIFTWHYLGGSAEGIARTFYGLESRAQGSAIFVSPEGINAGWANSGGRDVAFARAMVDKFKADYCIDEERIFSVGFSYGAIMSNTVGCAMGDVFRAIAPMAGSGPLAFGGAQCMGQVAAWLYHGTSDTVVSYSSGVNSRDHWLEANHCSDQHGPADDNGCVTYEGCDEGYPVIWCERSGAGHTQPSFGPDAIWEFFSQF